MDQQTLSLGALGRPGAAAVPRPPRRWGLRVGLPAMILAAAGGLLAYTARAVLTPSIEVTVAPAVPQQPIVDSDAGGADAAPAAVTTWVQAPGWVEPSPFSVHVAALTDGVVQEVLVLEGDSVKAGQVVATLIDTDARLTLRRAEAARREAESMVIKAEADAAAMVARLAELRDELERKQALSGSGAVAAGELARVRLRLAAGESEAQTAQASVEAAKAVVTSRQVECDVAQLTLDRTRIVAPCDGVVLSRMIEPGQRLNMASSESVASQARESGVMRLYDPTRLQVRVDVPMAEAGQVVIGAAAEVSTEAAPGRVFAGEVIGQVHEANIQRNTVQFKVKLDPAAIAASDVRLKPEMLCRVRLAGRSAAVGANTTATAATDDAAGPVSVPVRAIVNRRDDRAEVWVVRSDPRGGDRATKREVVLGPESEEGEITVQDGVRAGDRVVLDPPPNLTENAPVLKREVQP